MFLLRLIAFLPIRANHFLGKLLGRILWLIPNRPRHTTLANLHHSFPDQPNAEIRALAKLSLQHFGCLFTETAILWFWSVPKVQALINQYHGEAHIDALKDEPLIFIVPHFGAWEFLNVWGGKHYPGLVLYDDRRITSIDEKVKHGRERFGLTLLNISIPNMRQLLSALKNGERIYVLPDQVPTQGSGVIAPFMGQRAVTMTLIHRLVRSTSAKVLCLSCLRKKSRFEVFIDSVKGDVYDSDVEVSTAAMNEAIETALARDPTQYQWQYKRFRRIPGQDIYRRAN